MNGFQMTILGIFIFALILGVLIFAGVLPGFRAPAGGAGGTVVWWGTIPSDKLQGLLEQIQREHEREFTLTYVAKNPDTLEADLVEALALGRGPDLVTLPSNALLRQAAKLLPLPYANLSSETFKNTFVVGTHIRDWQMFLGPDGALALPLYVDPLVLYYNQDLLANAKVPGVPATWKELAETVKLLTKTDGRGNISQSAIAIGSFNNIKAAKDILALLLMQAGNPIVARDATGRPVVTLKDNLGFNKQPAAEAVGFFLRFADPANTLYSWNSSQPEAREAFVRGALALYFGFGSEVDRLDAQNPQLNFYLALPPQREGDLKQITIGRFAALALLRGGRNQATAAAVAGLLAGPAYAGQIAAAAGLPPARNDLLKTLPKNADQSLLYRAALITRDWLDPAPDKTASIFRGLVEAVALGRVDVGRAITDADAELLNLLPADENQ